MYNIFVNASKFIASEDFNTFAVGHRMPGRQRTSERSGEKVRE